MACFVLHIVEFLFSPPPRLPDIFPVLNVLVSTPVFVLVWLWGIKRGIEVSWTLGGLGLRSKSTAAASSKAPAIAISSSAKFQPFPSDGLPERGVDGGAWSTATDPLSPRGQGLRTMSLGFARGRQTRKIPRSGSVDIH